MSARVKIEPIARRHADNVQRLASHPDVVATTNLPDPYPPDGAEQWIDNLLPRQEEGDEYAFGILNRDGEFVGVIGLANVGTEAAELGFWIGKPYWNRGYATAAARKALRFAFEQLELERVFARPLRRNAPSHRVLEKLDFAPGSVETHEHPKWSEKDKVVRYELNRPRWRENSA